MKHVPLRYYMRMWPLLSILLASTLLGAPVQKPWTFLVYLAAANTLSPFAPIDIAEMIKVGSNANVNVIVYLTVFDSNNVKSTKKLYIEKGKVTEIGTSDVEDSGDVHTLMKALEWMTTEYPAEHYCVDLWNHGGGILNREGFRTIRAICYDDDTGHYLSDRDCLHAFSWAKQTLNNGKNIDVVATDACLMNMLEFAYTLSSCVNFLVGSETTVPGDGFEYARILNSFVRGVPTARTFSQTMVQVYQETYGGTPDYTLSAIDQSYLSSLVTNVNEVATALLEALKGSQGSVVEKYISAACGSVPNFGDGTYLDLLGFYTRLASHVPNMGLPIQQRAALQNLLKSGQTLINQCVIARVASREYKSAGGISFYFPQREIDQSYYDLYWTEHNPYLLRLLEQYVG
jgi:hypothetical protein